MIMSKFQINRTKLHDLLQTKVIEVINEPAHNWTSPFKSFMTGDKGRPVIRIGIVNFDLDTDIWAGLRSPALVGMYPVVPADIWRHYACLTSRTVRPDGSPNPLAMPEPFEEAKSRFRRGVIVCCINDRSQKAQLYEDYVCARCEVVCATNGILKSALELAQINRMA